MHEDNVSMNGNTTLGQIRNRAQGHERISIRTQRKVYWRLFGWYAGFSPLPYQRFKDLCLRSYPAESEQERAFLAGIEEYIASLGQVKDDPFVCMDYGVSVEEALSFALSYVSGSSLAKICGLNILLSGSLWPIRLHNGDKAVVDLALSGDVSKLADKFIHTPLLEESYIANLRDISREDIVRFLNDTCPTLPFSLVVVSGSFSDGTSLIDSDIDLKIVFEKGLTTEDKLEAIEALKRSCLEALGRYLDVEEWFAEEFKNIPELSWRR